MAKGFKFANKERQERKARSGGASVFAGKQIFKLPNDGDTGVVWFVPDDEGEVIYGVYVHEVPVEGRQWPDLVNCIAQDEDGNDTDDPCPGCERDLKRKVRYFAQVVWLEGPVYKKDDKGKLVKDNTGDFVVLGEEDQVAVWPMGPELEEALEEIDESYGDGTPGSGLAAGPYRIKRKGTKLETTYRITPADVKNPDQDVPDDIQELMEESEIDLGDFTKPPSYEEFEQRVEGKFTGNKEDNKGSSNGKSSKASRGAKKKNPFGGSRKKKRDEDEE
jgi:hypothetical protein